MKLIFFGEDLFSLSVLRALIESELKIHTQAIVILEPVSVSGKRLVEFASQNGIPLFIVASLKATAFQAKLIAMQPDLIIATHFQRILPAELFERAKVGAFNLHPSLLPKYKGMSPQHWPIIFGDPTTGVTVHRMISEVDGGNIMKQVSLTLEPDTYIYDLQKKFLGIYGPTMVDAIRLALDGFQGTKQSYYESSYFHRVTEKNMQVNILMAADRVYAMIRAFSLPYAGAWIDNLRLIRARLISLDELNNFFHLKPEKGIRWKNNIPYLILNDGALEITKWKMK
jgi:methionyl-tRNA formyltransferase